MKVVCYRFHSEGHTHEVEVCRLPGCGMPLGHPMPHAPTEWQPARGTETQAGWIEPATTHGRYVLTMSRLHVWAAFDANDITLIEAESATRALTDLREKLVRTVTPPENSYDAGYDEAVIDIRRLIDDAIAAQKGAS